MVTVSVILLVGSTGDHSLTAPESRADLLFEPGSLEILPATQLSAIPDLLGRARGRFVTLIAPSQRLRRDGLGRLAAALVARDGAAGYADIFAATSKDAPGEIWRLPEFGPRWVAGDPFRGSLVMWDRQRLLDGGGLRVDRFPRLAEFDALVRIGLVHGAIHLAEPLTELVGSHGDADGSELAELAEEADAVRRGFLDLPLRSLFPELAGASSGTRASALCKLGDAALTACSPWQARDRPCLRPEAAAGWYRRAFAEDPHHAATRYNMALLAGCVGRTDAARRLLGQLVEAGLDPELTHRARNFFAALDGPQRISALTKIPLLRDEPPPVVVTAVANSSARTGPRSSLIPVVWDGDLYVHRSLAHVNRQLCLGLLDRGGVDLRVAVEAEPGAATEHFIGDERSRLWPLHQRDVRWAPQLDAARAIWVTHRWPPRRQRPPAAHWVIMQPWELTSIPRDWVPLFNSADEVWTPSTFCRDVYVGAGVLPSRVHVIPNGIDPMIFSPVGPTLDLPTAKRFKFLYVGGTIARKGFDVLARAYGAAFTANDNVCLVVKDLGVESYYRHMHMRELIRRFVATENAPELHYRDESLPDEEMGALYRSCHALVAPYRGEGFALPVLEAMACGLPVIVTRGGATDDFVDDTVGQRVAACPRVAGDRVAGMELVEPATLLEPDHDELVRALRWVVTHPAQAAALGAAGARRAQAAWTWQHATDRILARVAVLGTHHRPH